MVICSIADCFLKCTSGIVFIMRGKPENDVLFFLLYNTYNITPTDFFPFMRNRFFTTVSAHRRRGGRRGGGIQKSIDTIG